MMISGNISPIVPILGPNSKFVKLKLSLSFKMVRVVFAVNEFDEYTEKPKKESLNGFKNEEL